MQNAGLERKIWLTIDSKLSQQKSGVGIAPPSLCDDSDGEN